MMSYEKCSILDIASSPGSFVGEKGLVSTACTCAKFPVNQSPTIEHKDCKLQSQELKPSTHPEDILIDYWVESGPFRHNTASLPWFLAGS